MCVCGCVCVCSVGLSLSGWRPAGHHCHNCLQWELLRMLRATARGGIGRRDSWIDHFSSNIQYCGNLYFFAGFQDILSFPILQDLKIPFVLRQVCLTLPKYREFSHFASISAFSFSKISTFLEIQISKNIFKIPKISKKSQNRQKDLQRFKALSIFSQVNCLSPEH